MSRILKLSFLKIGTSCDFLIKKAHTQKFPKYDGACSLQLTIYNLPLEIIPRSGDCPLSFAAAILGRTRIVRQIRRSRKRKLSKQRLPATGGV